MSKIESSVKFGIDITKITNFDIGDIEDQEMISKDFRKALFITVLSIISSVIMTGLIYLS